VKKGNGLILKSRLLTGALLLRQSIWHNEPSRFALRRTSKSLDGCVVAFQFDKASCVAVGTFNIYILHPQWLAKHDLIEKGTGVLMETNLAQPGFRFRLLKDRVTWIISPYQIAFESEDRATDCGARIATVLDALPETPLFGLGNNVVYKADLAELEALPESIRNFVRAPHPDADGKVVQQTLHVALKHDDHRTTNLQLLIKEESIELLCNLHTELRDRDTRTESVPAAKRFLEDRAASATLAQNYFGIGIEHAPSND
jgi:hypothetical protein